MFSVRVQNSNESFEMTRAAASQKLGKSAEPSPLRRGDAAARIRAIAGRSLAATDRATAAITGSDRARVAGGAFDGTIAAAAVGNF